MSKLISLTPAELEKPGRKEYLLELVEMYGKKKWSQITLQFNLKFGTNINYTQSMKFMYDRLISQQQYNDEQMCLLLQLFVKHRGLLGPIRQEFSEAIKQALPPYANFTQILKTQVKKALKKIGSMIFQQKKKLATQCRLLNLNLVQSLLQSLSYPESEDETMTQLQAVAHKLCDMLMIYADNLNAERQELYLALMCKVTRQDFNQLYHALSYLFELKHIYLGIYSRDIQILANNHPFLQKSIAECKNSYVYSKLFAEKNDYFSKYQQFCESQLATHHEGVTFEVTTAKMKVHDKVINQKKPKLRTVRGRIRQSDLQWQVPNQRTVIFDEAKSDVDESEYENEDVDDQVVKQIQKYIKK